MAAVPVGISYVLKDRKAAQHQAISGSFPDVNHPRGNDPNASPDSVLPPGAASAAPAQPVVKTSTHWLSLAWLVLLDGLASPFMGMKEPLNGLLGLVILFIGLRIAWRLTAAARLQVDGPFEPSAPALT